MLKLSVNVCCSFEREEFSSTLCWFSARAHLLCLFIQCHVLAGSSNPQEGADLVDLGSSGLLLLQLLVSCGIVGT